MEPNIIFQFVIPIGIVIVAVMPSFGTDIPQDTALPSKPCSYARVQLMWWTLSAEFTTKFYHLKNKCDNHKTL